MSIYNNRLGYDKEPITDSFFSIGIHPWDCNLVTNTTFIELETYLSHTNCLAIGECGLDKFIAVDLEIQKTIFEKQLQLALKYNKPLIIHCVKAFNEIIQYCQPHVNKLSIIIHGFNKSDELAEQLQTKGFYISISESFINKSSLSTINLNKIFFETDSNASLTINEVYVLAANKMNMDVNGLKEKIYRNFATIFNTHGR